MKAANVYRTVALAVLGIVAMAFVLGGIPSYSLDFALGQYGSDDDDDGSINRPFDSVGQGCVVGDTEPVVGAVLAPLGTRIPFSGVQALYFAPRLDAGTGLTVGPGEEYPLVCYNSEFTWALININAQGAWVPIDADMVPADVMETDTSD